MNASDLLKSTIRSAVVAQRGRLLVCDYAQIECRVLAWLAQQRDLLAKFENKEDVYCDLATKIYGRPITKADPVERFVGKTAVLGLGYGMGASKFQLTCEKYGVPLEAAFAERVKEVYRDSHPMIVQWWWDLGDAAIKAVKTGKPTTAAVEFRMDGRWLRVRLPSGRELSYCDPEIRKEETPWGQMRDKLYYMGEDSMTKKWCRVGLFGGKWAENICQAVARDFLVEAMFRLEAAGYPVVFTVHDEVVCETEEGSLEEMERLMAARPRWGAGCPLAVEGFEAMRFRK